MSSGKSNNNGGINRIPESSKKVIQSIKEIVNFPEDEIYFILKDCNMDPSEAVNRLLSQDTFHEVKSKREKKKEVKDVSDSRPRGSSSTRGGRGGSDRYSTRNSISQFGSSDYAASRGKPVYKKENGPSVYTNSTMGVAGNNANRWQTSVSDTSTDRSFSINPVESILPTPQPSVVHSAWSGMPGQVSMADIVKMGRQHGKTPSNLNVSQQHMNSQHATPSQSALSAPYDSRTSQDYDSGFAGHKNVPPNDEWLLEEEVPTAMVSATVEHAEPYNDPYESYDRTQQQFIPEADDVRFEGDDTVVDEQDMFVESVPESNQNRQEDRFVSASGLDDDQYQTYHHEAEDPNVSVSTLTNNFENLSVPKDNEDAHSEDDGPSVKIPDHLQVQTSALSHLSFGSFGSGMSAPFSGSFGSRPVHNNEEETTAPTDAPAEVHTDARNSEYYEDDHLRGTRDGNNVNRLGADSGNFEAPSVSQTDLSQQEAQEDAQANQYSLPSSTANYTFENNQQLNSSFAHSPATSEMMQGLPSVAGMPYANSLPNTMLASNMHPLREAELAYSQFPISQSMAGKYGNSVSSLSGPTASMAEALKSSNLPAQPAQTPPGGNISGATGLPQHLAMHPYSQHLGPLNMMGYPFLPQGYSYMPSAFQQAFAAGNSAYPQSLAAMLPQYKNSVSASSLSQSGAVPSGYGNFGNSNSIPSNFPMNPPTAPTGNSLNYEEALISHYKEAAHLLSLQQGAESRTMSGVPGNTYYSFQGQNQQPAGYRQSQQQPSQQYGHQSGYPNYYQSQGGLSLEQQQQQMSRDASLGASQGQQTQQQQMWQNSY